MLPLYKQDRIAPFLTGLDVPGRVGSRKTLAELAGSEATHFRAAPFGKMNLVGR